MRNGRKPTQNYSYETTKILTGRQLTPIVAGDVVGALEAQTINSLNQTETRGDGRLFFLSCLTDYYQYQVRLVLEWCVKYFASIFS